MEVKNKEYLHKLINNIENDKAIVFLIELIEKFNKVGWGF